jgi:kynureninase
MQVNKNFKFQILTPIDPEQRGAQLSLQFSKNVKDVHESLEKLGIVVGFNFFLN